MFELHHVGPVVVADRLVELQIRWSNAPVVFCEIRQHAEEWIYRFSPPHSLEQLLDTLRCNVSR